MGREKIRFLTLNYSNSYFFFSYPVSLGYITTFPVKEWASGLIRIAPALPVSPIIPTITEADSTVDRASLPIGVPLKFTVNCRPTCSAPSGCNRNGFVVVPRIGGSEVRWKH